MSYKILYNINSDAVARGVTMRTTVTIDDDLYAEALELADPGMDHGNDTSEQTYNGQTAVDAANQIVVAADLTLNAANSADFWFAANDSRIKACMSSMPDFEAEHAY